MHVINALLAQPAGYIGNTDNFSAGMFLDGYQVGHMVAVGEKAGQLEQMLERVAVTFESEVDTKLSRFTALLEPLMLVVMGGAVAFIVFSILQPIMDLGQLTGPK